MAQPRQLKAAFSVHGIPDTSGLRIRSTDPKGVYVSSVRAESATWYFEKAIIEQVIALRLLPLEAGDCLFIPERINWDEAVQSGSGIATVTAATRAEAAHLLQGATRLVQTPVEPLVVERWESEAGTPFLLVYDRGDLMDDWLIRSATEDMQTRVAQ